MFRTVAEMACKIECNRQVSALQFKLKERAKKATQKRRKEEEAEKARAEAEAKKKAAQEKAQKDWADRMYKN